jgi:putative hemolysin
MKPTTENSLPQRLFLRGCLVAALFCLQATALHAAEPESLTFVISNKSESFIELEEESLTLSKSCLGAHGKLDCQAYRESKLASFKDLDASLFKGGAPAGPVLCAKLGGKRRIGNSPEGNERGFCTFPDGSSIATDSLEALAEKNSP